MKTNQSSTLQYSIKYFFKRSIEHRLHQLECGECGKSTRAKLPFAVDPNHYGTSVVAMVAVLSGLYRHSQRTVKIAMAEIFDIRLSLGTINKLRMEASNAVEQAVEEAKTYIQNLTFPVKS